MHTNIEPSTTEEPPGVSFIIHSVLLLHEEISTTTTERRKVKWKNVKSPLTKDWVLQSMFLLQDPLLRGTFRATPQWERNLLNQNWNHPPAVSLLRVREETLDVQVITSVVCTGTPPVCGDQWCKQHGGKPAAAKYVSGLKGKWLFYKLWIESRTHRATM